MPMEPYLRYRLNLYFNPILRPRNIATEPIYRGIFERKGGYGGKKRK